MGGLGHLQMEEWCQKFAVFSSRTPAESAPERTSVIAYNQVFCCIARVSSSLEGPQCLHCGHAGAVSPCLMHFSGIEWKATFLVRKLDLPTWDLSVRGLPVTAKGVIALFLTMPSTLPFKHLNLLFLQLGSWMQSKGKLELSVQRPTERASRGWAASWLKQV